MKLFYIMGKSASGKDTLYKLLMDKFKGELSPLVIHTTRPIRNGETNGIEYYFDDELEFHRLKNNGRILEERSYEVIFNSEHTTWYYYTVNDHQFGCGKNLLGIGTLESYQSIRNQFGSNVIPIFIDVSNPADRLRRAIDRESAQQKPNFVELCRRFIADEEDFSYDNLSANNITKTFYNENIDCCVKEVQQYINQKLYD